ncbi:MAG: PQQ-binding-like beta-propeller repeat protein [Flavobacteriaceae bacterium]
MTKKTITFLMLFIVAIGSVNAQRSATWQKELDSPIKELVIDQLTGIVIVETQNELQAIAPDKKDIIWKHEKSALGMNKISADEEAVIDVAEMTSNNMGIELIPNTNLFLLTKGKQFLILNIETGEIKLNSVDKGVDLISFYFFPTKNIIVAFVQKGIKYQVISFDTKNLATVWEQPIEGSSIAEMFKLKSGADPAPQVDKDGNYLICFNRTIYKLDKATGEVLWQQGKRIKYFDYSPKSDVVVAYNTESNFNKIKGALKFSLKEKGEISFINNQTGSFNFDALNVENFRYAEDFGTDVLIGAGNRFNRYDYKTGEKKWKKDPKGKRISAINKTSKETYVYTADDEIMHIDANGEKIWKKPVQITDERESETLVLDETDKGNIVYITETHANIVDLNSGDKKWKKDLKLKFDEKRPTLAVADHKTKSYFIYNDEQFFTFTEQTNERPEEFSEVKIKKEKEVENMFNLEDKLVVTGTGEILAIDKGGNELYHIIYKEPGGFGRKLSNTALKIGSGLSYTIANATVSVNGGPEQGLFVEQGSTAQEDLNYFSNVTYGMVTSRFKAKNIDKYSYFFAKEGEGENKVKVLVKVDRATGEEVDKIIFNNNRPVYDIDLISQSIFYANGNTLDVFE